MSSRWSADSVLALAPDDSSRRAAGPLARPAAWTGAGTGADALWGLCAGSGKNPYQVVIDLAGPAYKCSCPSRKFPCKHALGLLLLWSAGTVPDAAEPADFARAWLDPRRDKQEKATQEKAASRPAAAGAAAAGAAAAGADEADRAAGPRDAAGAARRAAGRAELVTAGLADLQEWLRDQVRVGLAATAAPAAGGSGRPGAAASDLMAARMVDAQAPGVAGTLRGLSGLARGSDPAQPQWPARLLAEYGLLHLLARAHERLDTLPADLAAVVRSRVGYPVSRQDVLARPAVSGRWTVLAVRELTDAAVLGRRVWLRESATGQWAMLLTFAAPNGAWQDQDTARLRPGTEFRADLHYYPGQPALRAVLGQRHDADAGNGGAGGPGAGAADGEPQAPRGPGGDIEAMLTQWAAALEQDPWLTTWPVLLSGTPVPPGGGPGDRDTSDREPSDREPGDRDTSDREPGDSGTSGRPAGDAEPAARGGDGTSGWQLADRRGHALPLAAGDSLWTLLAVSGGQPVTVAGEWHPDGLVALTTWHGKEAVTL